MLEIRLAVKDSYGEHGVSVVNVVRGIPNPRVPGAFWYQYTAQIDDQSTGKKIQFTGKVLHSYKNGAVALAQKITKAIVKQQKELRK